VPTFNNLQQLEKYLNGMIRNALDTNVAETAKETMQLHIQRDVYAAYTPYSTDGKTPYYERTGQLLQDVEHSMLNNNTLVIENTRSENGRDIVKVIEEGKNYEWGYKRNLDEEIGKRPFVHNTFVELSKGLAKESLKEGLRRQGISVE
jgi:hypothetical protein